MQLIKDLLPNYLEKIKLAELEPGFILMVLIWLFSSFFSKKKSKKPKPSISKEKVSQKFQSLLRKLGDLPEIDINQPQKVYVDYKDGFLDEESINSELNFSTFQEEDSYDAEVDFVISEPELDFETNIASKSLHQDIKLYGTPLQKAMVLKEILDKPRALRPISFENYN